MIQVSQAWRLAAVAVVSLIVFVSGVAGAMADGNPSGTLMLGARTTATAGTTIEVDVNADAFVVRQMASGENASALRGEANGGTAGIFLSKSNNAIFAKVNTADRFALVAENDGRAGTGAALLAKGHKNAALRLEVDSHEIDPMSVNSRSLVDNLNVDFLDGLNAIDLQPGGTFLEGATITGAWSARSASGAAWESVSFGFSLGAAPQVQYVSPDAPATSKCPGSAEQPTATAGHLCVYESRASHTLAVPCIGDPVTGMCGIGSRYGFILSLEPADDAPFYAFGTWAVSQGADQPGETDGSQGDGRSIFQAAD